MLLECAAEAPVGAAAPRVEAALSAMADPASGLCTVAEGAALGRTEALGRGLTLAALSPSAWTAIGSLASVFSVFAKTGEESFTSDVAGIDRGVDSGTSDCVGIDAAGLGLEGAAVARSMAAAKTAGSGGADRISSSSSDSPQSSSMSLVAGTND